MLAAMDATRIAALLEPFLGGEPVSADLAAQLQGYLDLLLRWNVRINLTAVRDPEQIVTRHFGESLFAARVLGDAGAFVSHSGDAPTLADVGAGAGFPGVPIKLFAPEVQLTLIESQNKKATFLREVIRALGIQGTEVFCGRAENWTRRATIVTMRSVEKFETAMAVSASLVTDAGTLCLLIGAGQAQPARKVLGSEWRFNPAVATPQSDGRVVLVGKRIARIGSI
jgi:16S rRNA (guanine527-N7)-methyltransferase